MSVDAIYIGYGDTEPDVVVDLMWVETKKPIILNAGDVVTIEFRNRLGATKTITCAVLEASTVSFTPTSDVNTGAYPQARYIIQRVGGGGQLSAPNTGWLPVIVT